MASDPNPALRAELMAALGVLNPQIRGLSDLQRTSISGQLIAKIAEQISAREQRRDLVNAVLSYLDGALTALTALEGDGYPALPNTWLPSNLLAELQGEETALEAAVGLFIPEPAVSVGLDLTNATIGEQPVPPDTEP